MQQWRCGMKRALAVLGLVLLAPSGGCAIHRIARNPGRNAGLGAATSEKRAREIMGRNMFGVKEAVKYFRLTPSVIEYAKLDTVPFSEATLEQCKKTHILVAVFPLSINDIRSRMPPSLFFDAHDLGYEAERFATYKGGASWQLIRKTPVPNSFGKTWHEQQALLAKNEEVPAARVLVYAIIGHYLASGERLLEGDFVRSSDVDSFGLYRIVGYFGSDGLDVHVDWVGNRRDDVGMSSARKSEK